MQEKSMDYARGRAEESRRSRLFRALELAQRTRLISESVLITAKRMAAYIADDFETPVCAVEVQRLAEERCKDVSTIRRHINALIEAGLAEDRTAGNGLRGCFYGGSVVLGIGFGPALNRLDGLAAQAAHEQAAANEVIGLRRILSQLRKRLRQLGEEASHGETLQWLLTLPRRYVSLGRDELVAFRQACQERIASFVKDEPEVYPARSVEDMEVGQAKMRDGPRKIEEPYTATKKNHSIVCIGLGRTRSETPGERRSYEPVNEIPLARLIGAAPAEWRQELDALASEPALAGWSGFTMVARSFFQMKGGSAATWQRARDQVGERVASTLMLIATASSDIRDINGWMAAMTERARQNRVNAATPLYLLDRRNRMGGL